MVDGRIVPSTWQCNSTFGSAENHALDNDDLSSPGTAFTVAATIKAKLRVYASVVHDA